MAEQTTNRARLESETYTKLHEVMKQKSGGSADSIYPKLKAFSRFAQDMVTDVRGPAQSHMSGEFVEEWALACEHMQDKLRFYQKLLDQKRGKKTIVRVVKQYVAVDIETQVVDAAPIATAQPPRLKASPALSEAQVAKHNKACEAIKRIMKDIKTRELQNKEAVKNRGKYQEELRKAQSITTEDFAKTACIAQASQLIIEAQNIINTNEATIKQLRESKTRYLRDCLVVQSKRLNKIPEEDGDATESISKKTPNKSKPPATKTEPPKHKKRGGRAAKFAIGDDVEILYGSGSSRDWFPAQILENRGGYMVNILNSEGEIEEMERNVPVARLRAKQVDAEGSDDDDDEGDEEGEVPEEDEAPNPKKRKTTTHAVGARVQARVPPFGWMPEVALEKLEHLKKENEIRYGLKDYVAKPPEKKSKIVTAKYVLYSKFTLPDDRNIEDAHSYWVKWDKLHVIWTEGETADIYEYGGCSEEMETFKRPDDVFIGYEVAEVYDCDDTD
jgi:hypothetical protein